MILELLFRLSPQWYKREVRRNRNGRIHTRGQFDQRSGSGQITKSNLSSRAKTGAYSAPVEVEAPLFASQLLR